MGAPKSVHLGAQWCVGAMFHFVGEPKVANNKANAFCTFGLVPRLSPASAITASGGIHQQVSDSTVSSHPALLWTGWNSFSAPPSPLRTVPRDMTNVSPCDAIEGGGVLPHRPRSLWPWRRTQLPIFHTAHAVMLLASCSLRVGHMTP